MKGLLLLSVVSFCFLLNSCGLFRGGGGGEHCPAYGDIKTIDRTNQEVHAFHVENKGQEKAS